MLRTLCKLLDELEEASQALEALAHAKRPRGYQDL
jgi:hypothetical protein